MEESTISSILEEEPEKNDHFFHNYLEDGAEEHDVMEDVEEEKSSMKKITLKKNASANGQRVIAHIDLDCFYVQVERSHDPDLKGKPVAVVQYNPFGDLKSLAPSENRFKDNGSIIAVSYEARAKGVTRIMRGDEAKKACPEILLVQVPTSHGKADLQIYRQASAKIIRVLKTRYPSIIVERASVDEFYLDLTIEAQKLLDSVDPNKLLQEYLPIVKAAPTLIAGEDSDEMKLSKFQLSRGHAGTAANQYLPVSSTITVPDLSKDQENEKCESDSSHQETSSPSSWFSRGINQWLFEDLQLLAGAYLINQLRMDVFQELQFTCSAGIAENKMLAKLASAMHKPNKQTIVPKSIITNLLYNLPYNRIQGFGGKLGNEIGKLISPITLNPIKTMGEFLTFPKNKLIDYFGQETTDFILTRANGIDNDIVQDRSLPISIGCSKSFRQKNILTIESFENGQILHWLKELAEEIITRVEIDMEDNQRKPKQLSLGFSFRIIDDNKKPLLIPPNPSTTTATATTAETTTTTQSGRSIGQWFREQGLSFSKVTKFPSFHSINTFHAQVTADQIANIALKLIRQILNENPRIQILLSKVTNYNQELMEQQQQQQQPLSSTADGNSGMIIFKQWGITSLGLSANSFEPIIQAKNSIQSFFQQVVQSKRDLNEMSAQSSDQMTTIIDRSTEQSKKKPKKSHLQDFFQKQIQNDQIAVMVAPPLTMSINHEDEGEGGEMMKMNHQGMLAEEGVSMVSAGNSKIIATNNESIECIELIDDDDEDDDHDHSHLVHKDEIGKFSSSTAMRMDQDNSLNEFSSPTRSHPRQQIIIPEETQFPSAENDSKFKLFKKYLQQESNSNTLLDYETFLSFPEDIQYELINQKMFEKNFSTASSSSSSSTNRKGNSMKPSSSSSTSAGSSSIQSWFQMKK